MKASFFSFICFSLFYNYLIGNISLNSSNIWIIWELIQEWVSNSETTFLWLRASNGKKSLERKFAFQWWQSVQTENDTNWITSCNIQVQFWVASWMFCLLSLKGMGSLRLEHILQMLRPSPPPPTPQLAMENWTLGWETWVVFWYQLLAKFSKKLQIGWTVQLGTSDAYQQHLLEL